MNPCNRGLELKYNNRNIVQSEGKTLFFLTVSSNYFYHSNKQNAN